MRVHAYSFRFGTALAAMVIVAAFGALPVHAQNIEWLRQFGTNLFDEGLAVAKGPSGVYVTGHTVGTFPGSPLPRRARLMLF